VIAAMIALTHAVNDLQAIVLGSDHHKEGPFEHRDRKTIGDDDYNPAATRAVHERARRIAGEVSESFHRRLVFATGVDKSQARARGADAEDGGVIGTAKHQRGNVPT
jgi:hypothetical protein